jgi:hypothetical protein
VAIGGTNVGVHLDADTCTYAFGVELVVDVFGYNDMSLGNLVAKPGGVYLFVGCYSFHFGGYNTRLGIF